MPTVRGLTPVYEKGAQFRRGQLAMLVGRPGSQKSGFAMWMVQQWNLPTLYVSGDMSQFTASTRLASIYTGLTTDQVSDVLNSDDPSPVMTHLDRSPVDFLFDSEPSLDDIEDEIEAWVELRDAYPEVIVIDNLLDMQPLSDSSYQSNRTLLLELKNITRRTGAFVLVVHHNKEEGDPAYPAPSKAIQDKVSQTPELVLSIALDDTNGGLPTFRGALVKNRSGRASPAAQDYFEMTADPARTWFGPRDNFGGASHGKPF